MSRRVGWTAVRWGATALACFLSPLAARAADTTPPTKPVVTDDGAYTASATTLHAVWTSSDPESGIAESQYLIRQDSTSGAILVNWTTTGTTASVTRTGLSLVNGKAYFFQVKAKNGVGLWSSVGYADGIKVDAAAPTPPGQPKEGSSTTDADYDPDGSYTVYWSAAADLESGVAAYEVQEQVGATGSWTTLTSTRTSLTWPVSGRLQGKQYFYRIRAKNKAGLWGSWSPVSDGLLVDKTAPTPPVVTDDGATTSATTSLHAVWTSSDPESGISDSQYCIRRDSTTGTIIVNWASVGTATQVTKTGLTLINGKRYFFQVKTKNGAGVWSAIRSSDGILVQTDTTPPTGAVSINSGASYATSPTVTLTLSATDDAGTVAQMRCSNDDVTYSPAEAYATSKSWTLSSGDGPKTVYVKFSDPSGNWSSPVSDTITLDATPPSIHITSPQDGDTFGTP